MKRPWMICCLAVFVLVVGTGGVLAYNYVGRPALAAMNAARAIARIPQIESRVRNRTAFVPPEDGVMTADQVERYVRAATSLRVELEGRGAALAARFEGLRSRGETSSVRDLAFAYSEVARLIVAAKERQVGALNSEGFSLGEYAWVRTQTLAAAGLTAYQVDLQRLRDGGDALLEARVDVPPENVELVRGLEVQFEELLPLAAFGL